MRTLAGRDSQVHFTHLSSSSSKNLSSVFSDVVGADVTREEQNLEAQGVSHQIGVLDLMEKLSVPMNKVCLLDPKAELELSPSDGEVFDWFLFGGILGA